MADDLKYSRVPPHRFNSVIQHLRLNFFADEPLNKSLSLCKPGEQHEELEAYSLNVLSQEMSTMVTRGEEEEVVGVCLMGRPTRDGAKEKCTDWKLQKIFNFIGEVVDDTEFNLNEVIDLKIISVDDSMRGKGIGGQLYINSEKVARDLGFRVMRAEATALFSQKVLQKYGWKTLKEIKYSEYPSKENPMFQVAPPHETFKFMVKYLD